MGNIVGRIESQEEQGYYEFFGPGYTLPILITGLDPGEIVNIFKSINKPSGFVPTLEKAPEAGYPKDTCSLSAILEKDICPHHRLAVLEELVTPLNKIIEGRAQNAEVEKTQLNSTLEHYLYGFFKSFYDKVYTKIPDKMGKDYNLVVQKYGLTYTYTLKSLLDENSQLVPAIFLAILDKIDIEIKNINIENTTDIDILLAIDPQKLMVLFNKLAIGFNGSLANGSGRIEQLIDFKFNVNGLPELSINTLQHKNNQKVTQKHNQNRKDTLNFLLKFEEKIKEAGGELLVTQDQLYHWLGNTGVCPVFLGDNPDTSKVYLQQILLCLRVIEHWHSPRKRHFEP